jgi:hypothetical protein
MVLAKRSEKEREKGKRRRLYFANGWMMGDWVMWLGIVRHLLFVYRDGNRSRSRCFFIIT